MKTYKCKQCEKYFKSKKGCRSRQPKYCSKKCYSESLKINVKCKMCGLTIKNRHSSAMKNRVYCSRECYGKSRKNVPLSKEWRKALSEGRKKSDKCKGENLYNWKGGKRTELIRNKEAFYKRKKGLKEKMPVGYLKRLLKLQDNKCFYCDCDILEYKAIEHLTPVSKGGDNHIYNLVYSCKSCNSKKRQNTLEQYAIKNKRFDWLEKWENNFIEAL